MAGRMLPSGWHLSFEASEESYFVAREDDDENMVRMCWYVKTCPCSRQCSQNSWYKAQPWSFLSKDKCLDYLAHHLVVSGLHSKSEQEAYDLLVEFEDFIEWNEYEDTFAMREAYRKQLEGVRKRKREASSSKGSGKCGGGDGGGHDKVGGGGDVEPNDSVSNVAPGSNHQIELLTVALRSALSQLNMGPSGSGASSAAGVFPAGRDGVEDAIVSMNRGALATRAPRRLTIDIRIDEVLALQDKLKRSEAAVKEAMYLNVETARRLQAEKDVLTDCVGKVDELLARFRQP